MDLPYKLQKASHVTVYDPVTGDKSQVMRYMFYLGKNGPFTEDVALTVPFDEQEIARRVQKLRQHLQQQA